MRTRLVLLTAISTILALRAEQRDEQRAGKSFACPVTLPSAKPDRLRLPGGNYGNEFLATAIPDSGKVIFAPGGPGFVLDDGALEMKFPWFWSHVEGHLRIEGRRLDAPAAPLRAEIPANRMSGNGFQPSSLIFPTPGCWEVSGRVGTATVTFVTQVVKIGAGPSRASQ